MQEMQSSSSKTSRLDGSLSKILFNYIVPSLNPKYTIKDKKLKKKSKSLDISLLEEIILSKINKEKIKVNKKINDKFNNISNKKIISGKNIFDDLSKTTHQRWVACCVGSINSGRVFDAQNSTQDGWFSSTQNSNSMCDCTRPLIPDKWNFVVLNEFEGIDEKIKNIDYSLELTRNKEFDEQKSYSVSITYEENADEERLDITIKPKNYFLDEINQSINENSIKKGPLKNSIKDKNKEEIYSISIINKKENKNKSNYSIKITYEDNYQQERLSINYKEGIGGYQKRREDGLQDFSDRVPGKFVHVFPHSVMGGVLGFTYLGENFMGKREDMIGNKMVDVHESIHTDNEYETRLLTSWILSKERTKYVR